MIVGHSENQFVHGDSGEKVGLACQPRVGGVVELEKMLHLRRWKSEARQHALTLLIELIGDEPMCVVLRNGRGLWEHRLGDSYKPPRRASSSWRTRSMEGTPPFNMYASGVLPPKMGFVFGNWTQASASLVP